jgi:hypothetical protein
VGVYKWECRVDRRMRLMRMTSPDLTSQAHHEVLLWLRPQSVP